MSFVPAGLSGRPSDSPKSWNWPGLRPLPGAAVNVIVPSSSVSRSPSSALIGLASFVRVSVTLQPGTGSYDASENPGGIWTSTFTVRFVSSSLGTRTSRRAKPPAGASAGCTVTWAPALAGSASVAATATAAMVLRVMARLLVEGKGRISAPAP